MNPQIKNLWNHLVPLSFKKTGFSRTHGSSHLLVHISEAFSLHLTSNTIKLFRLCWRQLQTLAIQRLFILGFNLHTRYSSQYSWTGGLERSRCSMWGNQSNFVRKIFCLTAFCSRLLHQKHTLLTYPQMKSTIETLLINDDKNSKLTKLLIQWKSNLFNHGEIPPNQIEIQSQARLHEINIIKRFL